MTDYTFPIWLTTARITSDATGAFISRMRNDPTEVPDLQSLGALKTWLRRRPASLELIAVAPIVWDRYRTWMRWSKRKALGRDACVTGDTPTAV
jgi:hypothetical protein